MRLFPSFLLLTLLLQSCIGDDIVFDTVDPVLRINAMIDTLGVGETHDFTARYLNNIGVEEERTDIAWFSSNEDILSLTLAGEATALALGEAQVIAELNLSDGTTLMDQRTIVVGEETVETTTEARSGTIQTTTFYTLEGSFTLTDQGGSLLLEIADDYEASSSLPGLYLYLSNNPNSIANALEVSKVTVFDGTHDYTIEGVELDEYSHLLYYCKPFNVKVGDGLIGE